MFRFVVLAVFAFDLAAQDASALAAARIIDGELLKLHDLSEAEKARAIPGFARRIREQPGEYAEALAFNLAIEVGQDSRPEILRLVAATLVDGIKRAPTPAAAASAYRRLAEMAHYYRTDIAAPDIGATNAVTDSPLFRAAVAEFEANDKLRSESDFTLADLRGRTWNLKDLRGRVVLVNFWSTNCPPCREEIPDLSSLRKRFGSKSLVILGISDDDASTLKQFASHKDVGYPLLADAGRVVHDRFRVRGIPHTLVYDRAGRLVAQAIEQRSRAGLLEMLGRAGLK